MKFSSLSSQWTGFRVHSRCTYEKLPKMQKRWFLPLNMISACVQLFLFFTSFHQRGWCMLLVWSSLYISADDKHFQCNKMTCPNCTTKSCYICRRIVQDYTHFEQACILSSSYICITPVIGVLTSSLIGQKAPSWTPKKVPIMGSRWAAAWWRGWLRWVSIVF